MSIREQLVYRLHNIGQYGPTCRRYQIHIEACQELGVLPETFETFAIEVLNTPPDKRDWLLSFEPIQNVEPFLRYRQYDTPIAPEMVIGWGGRKRK